MPTFSNILKKKRTKDSGESKDLPKVVSPTTAQPPASPVSTSTHQSQPSSQTTQTTDATSAGSPGTDETMPHHQSPTIHNLVHSQHSDGASAERAQPRQLKGKYALNDFTIERTLGTGSFGRVHLVQSKHNQRYYAVKVLKKQQVVKMKQIEHTNDERRMLQRVKHPFLITLWGTFQDAKNLYMVMDFIEGGELFSLLRKSQVRCYRSHNIINVAW